MRPTRTPSRPPEPRDSASRHAAGLRGTVVLAFLIWAGLSGASPAGAEGNAKADAEGVAFFEKNIRPILIERCASCHSSAAKKVGGNLRLDSKAGWQTGGDLGPAIEPGDPENSLLIEAIRYKDDALKMPPKGKLPDREVELLTRWVGMGAPDPRDGEAGAPSKAKAIDVEQGRAFWSFRPPADPPAPDVQDTSWPRSPLDRFILAKLESEGLRPAPEADKRTLIRRATFDLIGLPPTPEEVDAFVADDSPGAFAAVVERLLASPRYGERWGRHWLDVARYSDSNGLDENTAFGNAWRYRDYVIRSFNADVPYDRFVLEQLAGDLLPRPDSIEEFRERLTATGFLALGPKVLAEVDEKKMVMDIVDEQIDTVGRAFMGLTLGCARCHDHKFDPITAADYYGLSGIFQSTRTMETTKKLARWHEHPAASKDELVLYAAHEKEVKRRKAEIDAVVAKANEVLTRDGSKLPKMPESLYPEATKAELKRLRDALGALEAGRPEPPSIMGVAEGDAVVDAAILIRGNHLTLGEVVPRRFPLVLTSSGAPAIGKGGSGRLELARWLVGEDHPLTSRVMVNRIWRWHFGRGLVLTPDNFGTIGDKPVHPELLDWLARRFVEGRWSIKAMHRLIMLSSTYRMGDAQDPEAVRVDPENRLHGRWTPRRLEAEEVRDALLAAGGLLDTTMRGPVLHVKNREYLFDHTSIDRTKYDTRRRSVYLPVIRNNVYDVFGLFDFADPTVTSGDRGSTTVALQALFLMNSELVHEVAGAMAGRLLGARGPADDHARVRRLFEVAYGRPPTDAEASDALAFLSDFAEADRASGSNEGEDEDASRLRAWRAYCQVVVASTEFLYIR